MLTIRYKQLLNLPVRRIVFLIAVLISVHLSAQIVDDSTKLVYGPTTTKSITEVDILNNQESYLPIDTSIYLFERQSFVDQSERKFQNLGSFGTALFPIFYPLPNLIGRTSGYTAYTRFGFDPSEVTYYDTKSPFLDLFVYLGGKNRNIVDVGFSRNVSKDWNIGFKYRSITTDKQLARDGQGDRQVVGASFVGYSHYKHPTIPYQVLLNYSVLKHDVVELGGGRYPTADSLESDLFLFDNALLRLENAQTRVRERQLHLYQDFQIAEQFQLYHRLDYKTEQNTYQDFSDGASSGYNTYTDFYPNFFIDEDSTYQRASFNAFENEAGIKGDLSNIFYRGYLKIRKLDFRYNYLDPGAEKIEQYIGGYARFRWKDKFAVVGEGEYLLGEGFTLEGSLSSNLLNVSYKTSRSNVPFIYDNYFGNHHEWANSFNPIFSNDLTGSLDLKYKGIELIPTLRISSFQNFVYFDAERQARQASGTSILTSAGGRVNIRLRNDKGEGWHFENELIATTISGGDADVFRVPPLFYNGRLFWRGNWFEDKVPFEVGLDAHAQSSYFGHAYAPELQQFYLQNEFEMPGYYKADVFINMRLDKFFMSLKWTHFNQPRNGGYFASPYFPGQQRTIDLIVRWMFFD